MNKNDFAIRLGSRIRELRKLKGISQLELVYDMDMSMNTISGIELGKISPKVETLMKIAKKLDIDIAEFFDFHNIQSKDKIVRKKVEEISHKLLEQDKEFIDLVGQSIEILHKARKLK